MRAILTPAPITTLTGLRLGDPSTAEDVVLARCEAVLASQRRDSVRTALRRGRGTGRRS